MRYVAFALALFASHAVYAMAPKDVYKKAGPAVTLVLGSDDGRQGSSGTGSIITPEGKMITNAHVVLNHDGKPYKMIYIYLKPPVITGDNTKDLVNRYNGKVVAYSPPDELDLALIQIQGAPAKLPTVNFANPNNVEVGDEVVAIGHPEQGGLWTLTSGTVSTVIANFNGVKGKDVFQTEASVNRGNSGGPLLDDQGNMVGINTMIARQAPDGLTITSVNFALKSSVAVNWLAGQGMGLAYARPSQVDPTTGATTGSVAVAVAPQPNKPATTDTVVAMNDTKPTSAASTPATTGTTKPTTPTTPTATVPVDQTPPATVVVVQDPPKQSADAIRQEGQQLGTQKQPEKLTKGKPLDPTQAKPTYHTQKRPYNADDLRRQQMKELDDMMDEMRGKVDAKRGGGMW